MSQNIQESKLFTLLSDEQQETVAGGSSYFPKKFDDYGDILDLGGKKGKSFDEFGASSAEFEDGGTDFESLANSGKKGSVTTGSD